MFDVIIKTLDLEKVEIPELHFNLNQQSFAKKYQNAGLDRKKQLWASRYLLAEILNTSFQAVITDGFLGYDQFHRPYISEQSHYSFNISHTENTVVVVVGMDEVGVDIESWDREINLNNPRKVFSPAELNYANDDSRIILKLWTVKEAVLKAAGVGLRVSPNQVLVDLQAHSALFQDQCFNLIDFQIGNQICGTIAQKLGD
ncbi:4'-phosphopantetheinyl transferase family protein [Pediococcus claussenii]|uniref:4'-phosphopantetheinyl transferase superfamily protein n=1 Tax=Pediococcus claussenii (strain ATCC BAA-344 / DSM 14800 / JCM 18046 / KCTC 3811 / LMG 21948 / P06) TaxID=701521 RepID=G8PER4_PEDCP|nr:4'-phosphopantetheinyl transferase superfamily protein [Pediococcus claussenii]AEV94444.1 4'-phosphopantetheinyl transferase superfamily protein [Pediococcus claussenii ATCC BAA-344]ANZ69662.1 hypothetical protein AYR57_04745 [Pediococcus claussenii]ANZ71479.1 hypothetical protein AYR58_04750 [Pediococcus claussenii]KRN19852.1 hypothetical protein IV79_GL001141 [Pediococcus claussenii]